MKQEVQNYYGDVLQSSDDLQTNACCTDTELPSFLKEVLSLIHDEVLMRYYGCGLVAPQALEGKKILDLGCGSGRDVYALSKLVGEDGFVVGVDMTDKQLEVAKSHQEYHRKQFGYANSNVQFLKGDIEHLSQLDLEPGQFDVIVSNCVINLATDKKAVLQGAYNLLKEGGEMYFSDVYASRRIDKSLQQDPVLYGECLSGALYWNDFLNLAKQCGFLDPRLVEDRPLTIENQQIQDKVGPIQFYSATYRLFKLPALEPACEDYGQTVKYKGTIPHQPHALALDKHHYIEKGRWFSVCGNTYNMLAQTRFAEHFEFMGDFSNHYGIFEGCGTDIPFENDGESSGACC